MVSILPPKRNIFNALADSMAQFGQHAPELLEKRYQTSLGLSALDKAEKAIQEGIIDPKTGEKRNLDPHELALQYARVGAQNPSLERILGPLYQTALTQSQRKIGAEEFPVGGNMPTRQGETPEQQVPVSVRDLVSPQQQQKGNVADPRSVGKFELPYGPEQIAQIRQQSRQRNYTPEMEDRFVADAQEFNQIAKNRRDIELQNYQQQEQERQDTLANQKAFEGYLVAHSPEFAQNPDELQLALKASEKYQNEPSFAERNAKIKEELRPYQAAKNSLKKGLMRPLLGMTKDQLDIMRPRAQMMVDMGQKPQLQLMIANGGHGQVEEAMLLNPLPNQLDKSLGSWAKFVNPLEKVSTLDVDSPKYDEQLENGIKTRQEQEKRLSQYLAETIKPGPDYNHPGTNLLLVRKHLMDKGASWEDSAKIIDQAIARGKLKLDPQQQKDYQELGMPPLTGETYFDTVMNNLMFPVTGKE